MQEILVAGELNVDLILTGLEDMPVLGREILAGGMALSMGGSAPNTACACASLGLRTAFFGKVGQDAYGEVALERLRHYRVNTELLIQGPALKTGITVSLSTAGDRAMVTWFGDSINGFAAEEVDLAKLPARHLHVGSYSLQDKLWPGLQRLFERARALNMTTSLDPGWDDTGRWGLRLHDLLRHTDYFFPNEQEAAAITGVSDPHEAAKQLAGFGCTAVVKLGKCGALACLPDGRSAFAPGYPVSPVDTTGAGDSFNAGFLYAALHGDPIETCLRYGNACGAVCVTRVGGVTRCPTLEEVETMVRGGAKP